MGLFSKKEKVVHNSPLEKMLGEPKYILSGVNPLGKDVTLFVHENCVIFDKSKDSNLDYMAIPMKGIFSVSIKVEKQLVTTLKLSFCANERVITGQAGLTSIETPKTDNIIRVTKQENIEKCQEVAEYILSKIL